MKQAIVLICSFFLLSYPEGAFASLYINEFSSGTSSDDWIEIYNSGSVDIDLAEYILRDSTSTNKIDLSGTISSDGFMSFDWSNKLNNSGDTIRLLLKSGENVIDQIIYGQDGDVMAPLGAQTAGRSPNGNAKIVMFSTSSKGESNNSSGILPSPTLTPTVALTPTRSPSPTKTPTVKPTPTTKSSAISPTKTSLPSISATKPASSNTLAGKANSTSPGPTAVLGASESGVTDVPEESADQEVKTLGQSDKKLPIILLIAGVFMGCCAILAFLIFKKRGKSYENL